MNDDDAAERRHEAARWLAIALEDARVAGARLRLDPPAPGMAAYHCQQTAEKILKGFLIAAGAEFALTHDLDRLASTAELHYPDAGAQFDAIRPLTVWGIAYRYPGPETAPEPPPSDAEIEQVLAVLQLLGERLGALLAD